MALSDHLAVEVGVENVDGLGVLASRWLEHVILVEFEPKPNQVIIQVLARLQFVPLAPGYLDLTVSDALLVREHGHGVSVAWVALIDQRVGVEVDVELDAGNLDRRHQALVRQFLLVGGLIDRVCLHRRVDKIVFLQAHWGLGCLFLRGR